MEVGEMGVDIFPKNWYCSTLPLPPVAFRLDRVTSKKCIIFEELSMYIQIFPGYLFFPFFCTFSQ